MNNMDNSANDGLRSTIQPYYMRGDVFKRDQRYYDQILDSRRVRSGNKRYYESRNRSRDYQNRSSTSGVARNVQYEDDQTRRLRQQNTRLMNELQKLSYGGQFGTGDEVVKKQYYTGTHQQNETIRGQQMTIRKMQQTVRFNNDKLMKYQKAVNELEIRMNNIQSIDRQIYRQLKGASMRDVELLERAKSELLRNSQNKKQQEFWSRSSQHDKIWNI